MNKKVGLSALVVFLMLAGMAQAAGTPGEMPIVAGLVGMTPVTESSYAAVWIPVPKGKALDGVVWYNNDGLAVFPELLVASGTADQPVAAASCEVLDVSVAGQSSGWSTFDLPAPIRSSRGGFYVLFRFPTGSEYSADGAGGGAGIGYVEGGGCTGWLSIDGQEWVKVGRSCGFAVVPSFVDADEGMLDKTMGGADGSNDAPARVYATALLSAVPNPFNPETQVRFTLNESAVVELQVFDVRGRKVVDLARSVYGSGEHAVRWAGRDSRGQAVASGVYLVRMKTAGYASTQRVLLSK